MSYSLLFSQYFTYILSTQQIQQTCVGGIKQVNTQSSKEIHGECPLGQEPLLFYLSISSLYHSRFLKGVCRFRLNVIEWVCYSSL